MSEVPFLTERYEENNLTNEYSGHRAILHSHKFRNTNIYARAWRAFKLVQREWGKKRKKKKGGGEKEEEARVKVGCES